MSSAIHILGIRHHGPGSARSVLHALTARQPDCVLIEGPPDADDLIAFAGRAEMKPPVAILVHDTDQPIDAVYYPFAEFSPEWQAMRWALSQRVAVRFMDLPQMHRMAIHRERLKQLLVDKPPSDPANSEQKLSPPAHDPMQQLAEAAGFDDGETWWEHVIESHAHHESEIFLAIQEAMNELRTANPRTHDLDEPLREAWMRRSIREAKKAGHANIAVICGAWHAPALDVEAIPKKQDDDLLKGLLKIKTSATWVPWTFDRLTFASGYGAGVRSPGWYEHLWQRKGPVLESWMTRVARLLREKDIDCSSAHVIESVRLASSVASMRGRPVADLSDISDATRAIFCFDSDAAMRLIHHELLVGIRMGALPDDIPMVPLQQDLAKLQKRLRFKPEAQDRPVDLDLRNDTDRERSLLLHRLRLIGVEWGTPRGDGRSKGTFRESWMLRWEPSFTLALIDASVYGSTVESAAQAKLIQLAKESADLKGLTARLQDALLADLGGAATALVQQIESVAALASDVTLLMGTLPSLAALLRYGNVRQTDAEMVRQIVDGMIPRIAVGVGGALASLNDEAAIAVESHLSATDAAIVLVDSVEHTQSWRDALARVIDQPSVHGLIRGRCARLLLDAGRLNRDAIAQRLGQTLSRGNDPAQGARWLEGFLRGSGLLLIHDANLLALIDEWIAGINGDVFEELLPLLRRTFTTFPSGERRQIGEMIRKPTAHQAGAAEQPRPDFNHERAARAIPLILQLFGGDT